MPAKALACILFPSDIVCKLALSDDILLTSLVSKHTLGCDVNGGIQRRYIWIGVVVLIWRSGLSTQLHLLHKNVGIWVWKMILLMCQGHFLNFLPQEHSFYIYMLHYSHSSVHLNVFVLLLKE